LQAIWCCFPAEEKTYARLKLILNEHKNLTSEEVNNYDYGQKQALRDNADAMLQTEAVQNIIKSVKK